jgi:hypothetical protein
MGLDMHLLGEISRYPKPVVTGGFKQWSETIELGYWRKHPDLHGYIVQTFAKGVDECQRIDLELADLKRIHKAVASDKLPHTEGFFFGTSRPEDKQPTLKILDTAIRWLENNPDAPKELEWKDLGPRTWTGTLKAAIVEIPKGEPKPHEYRSVYYKASW